MIAKREYNPELSSFNNLLLDLVDFKDRVRPLANDLSLLDVSQQYQTQHPDYLFGKEKTSFTQAEIDNFTPEQKAEWEAAIDLIAGKDGREAFLQVNAADAAEAASYDAFNERVNKMFGVENEDPIMMEDLESIDIDALN